VLSRRGRAARSLFACLLVCLCEAQRSPVQSISGSSRASSPALPQVAQVWVLSWTFIPVDMLGSSYFCAPFMQLFYFILFFGMIALQG
jgi:hypothetical protein